VADEAGEAERQRAEGETDVGPAGSWDGERPCSPRECGTRWPCCILQQLLRLLPEPLQCASYLQNAGADAAPAAVGDSLRQNLVWDRTLSLCVVAVGWM
jgi:hypothetical protein